MIFKKYGLRMVVILSLAAVVLTACNQQVS
jgi:predicted small secreted protein